jgi:putative membrane protein
MTSGSGSGPDSRLFDPGLQPERTDLAWRRTTLALAVGAIVALRLLPPILGVWSLAAALAGFLFATSIWILAGHRARKTREALLQGTPPPHGGALMLMLAVTTSFGASLGMLYVALR